MCQPPSSCPGGAHRNALQEDHIETPEQYQALAKPIEPVAEPSKPLCEPCPGDPNGTGFCEFHECERDCQTVEPSKLEGRTDFIHEEGCECISADGYGPCQKPCEACTCPPQPQEGGTASEVEKLLREIENTREQARIVWKHNGELIDELEAYRRTKPSLSPKIASFLRELASSDAVPHRMARKAEKLLDALLTPKAGETK